MAPARASRRGATVGVVLLAIFFAATASAARASLLPLHAAHDKVAAIANAHSQRVILHGVAVTSLTDQYQVNPELATVPALGDDDFAEMQTMGFNVVRLAISWSALEPRRGHFDHDYVAQIQQAVDLAAAHNIYTILDMHQ